MRARLVSGKVGAGLRIIVRNLWGSTLRRWMKEYVTMRFPIHYIPKPVVIYDAPNVV